MEQLFKRLNISKDAIDEQNLIKDTYNLFKFFKEHPIIYENSELGGKRLEDGRYYYIGRNEDNTCIYDKNEIFEICVENKRLNIKKKRNKFIKKYDTKFSGGILDRSKSKNKPINSWELKLQGEVFKQNMTEKKRPCFNFKKYGSKENAYEAAVKYMKKMNYKYKTIKNRVRWMGDHYEGEVWHGEKKNGGKDMKRLYCKFDKEHLELFTKYIWYAVKHSEKLYYVVCDELRKKEGESRLFHQHVCKDEHWEKSIDHINGNGLDNRKSNLRDGSKVNPTNNTMQTNNTSGFNGVSEVKNEDGILIAYRSTYPGEEKGKKYGGHSFSIKKYGKEEAYNLAVKDRKAYDARSGCMNGVRT
jgi:hypothetical protein